MSASKDFSKSRLTLAVLAFSISSQKAVKLQLKQEVRREEARLINNYSEINANKQLYAYRLFIIFKISLTGANMFKFDISIMYPDLLIGCWLQGSVPFERSTNHHKGGARV